MQTNNSSKGNAPEKKFRAGAVTATIWANEGKNQNGEVTTYKTISIERSYKDKEDKWQSTNSMRLNDLPRASLVLDKAYEYLVLKDGMKESTSNEADDEIF